MRKASPSVGFWCLAAGVLVLVGAGFLPLVTVVRVIMLIAGVGLLILGVLFAVNLDVNSTIEKDKPPMPFIDGGAGPIGGAGG
jgi:hypothetical protein